MVDWRLSHDMLSCIVQALSDAGSLLRLRHGSEGDALRPEEVSEATRCIASVSLPLGLRIAIRIASHNAIMRRWQQGEIRTRVRVRATVRFDEIKGVWC